MLTRSKRTFKILFNNIVFEIISLLYPAVHKNGTVLYNTVHVIFIDSIQLFASNDKTEYHKTATYIKEKLLL